MKFTDKIKWRLKLLLDKNKLKNPEILLYNLLPSGNSFRNRLLVRIIQKDPELREIIKMEKESKKEWFFDLQLMELIYPKNMPLADFIADYLSLIYPYVQEKEPEKDLIKNI